jgi:hypothetical protein
MEVNRRSSLRISPMFDLQNCGSDDQSQQSGQHKTAQKHRPVPNVEAEKSAISREVNKPQHDANLD